MKPLELTEDAYRELCDENGGYCLTCGATAYGVEPDARQYPCEACGSPSVHGAEECLLMGRLRIVA